MTSPDPDAPRIAGALADCLAHRRPLDAPLDELLRATAARAVGLWKLQHDHLVLLGFRGAADMPDDVKREFAAATARVPLDQTGLGIVKAALTRRPAIAELAAADLGASAGWLARFAATRSLAVPIERPEALLGVLAVSTTEPVDPTAPTSATLTTVAAHLVDAL